MLINVLKGKQMRVATKVKTVTDTYGDGQQITDIYKVTENGKRIGSVFHCKTRSGAEWFDPYRGEKGVGKAVMVGFQIQRKKTLEAAVKSI